MVWVLYPRNDDQFRSCFRNRKVTVQIGYGSSLCILPFDVGSDDSLASAVYHLAFQYGLWSLCRQSPGQT